MKFAFRHLFAILGLLLCLACNAGSANPVPLQDGDITEEAEPDLDHDDTEPIAEEDAEVEDADGDCEDELGPDDDDLTIDPDPNWEKELDAGPKEAEDPNPPLVLVSRFYLKNILLEADESITYPLNMVKSGLLIVTSKNRLLSVDPHNNIQWEYLAPSINAFTFLFQHFKDEIPLLATRYTTSGNSLTVRENLAIILDSITGHADEYNLSEILTPDAGCIPPGEEKYYSIAADLDWVVVVGLDMCSSPSERAFSLWGISRLDRKLKWQIPFAQIPIYPYPDGSFWSYSFDNTTTPMQFRRISPLGEILVDKPISLQTKTYNPYMLSNGTLVIQTTTGLSAISSMGEILWQKAMDLHGELAMVDEDDSLITQVGSTLYRYAPNGDYLHQMPGMPMEYQSPQQGPYIAPAPWRWGLFGELPGDVTIPFLQASAPYSGQPETIPSATTCSSVQAESSVVTRSHEPAQAATEDWTLRRVKDDSTYSCPLKPDIANPFDSWAANAWSDAILDTVWIGGYDALWRYDTRTREATCLKIGNVEVISGHINQGATTLAYVTDGRLFIGPADGSATTSHALPDDMGVILSLALDADTVAIGGPKGLWLRALTTETWTKIESCCGNGLQVNQSGLLLDGGTLWAGAYGGVYRIDPVAKSCAPQCLATEPDMIFEIYGRSEHGVWVAWQEDPSKGQQAPYQGNTVGECLDNGVWFPQLTTSGDSMVIGAVKKPEGLLALKLEPKNLSSDPNVSQCAAIGTLQSLPEPIGRSAELTLPLGALYPPIPPGTCGLPGYLGQKIVPTKNGYFTSGLWMEALRKQSVPK